MDAWMDAWMGACMDDGCFPGACWWVVRWPQQITSL